MKKTAFIDCDFMPPTAERLCQIPELVKNRGYDSLCLKIIDNYPWSFDCRMKADTSFDEKVIDYISSRCISCGLSLLLVFPGENDYCRILRLNGYRRMVSASGSLLKIDPESLGFTSLVETVLEDFTSLFPELYAYAMEVESESNQYYRKVSDIIGDNGSDLIVLSDFSGFTTVNRFIDSSDSEPDSAYLKLEKAINLFSDSVFGLNRFLTMSSLGSNMPAADLYNLNAKYADFLEFKQNVKSAIEDFNISASGKLDEGWLGAYVKSVLLTVETDSTGIIRRLSASGMLN